MLIIKHIASGKEVIPMPSSPGLFSDTTIPNCTADSACRVRAAQILRSHGVDVILPTLTAAEIATANAAQLADKANWKDYEKALNVVSDEEVAARRDSIRGYTEAAVLKYIADNSEEGEDPISDQTARAALHRVDHITRLPVTVPSDESISSTILAEKEAAMAANKATALINSGHLVTDLSHPDYTDWNALFTVIESVAW